MRSFNSCHKNLSLASYHHVTETGFCSFDVDETMWGTYMWPETSGESTSSLTCQLDDSIIVTRLCQPGGTWDMPQYGNCIMLGNVSACAVCSVHNKCLIFQ